MSKQFFPLFSVFFLLCSFSYSQTVPVMSFEKLEQRINHVSDTLFIYNFWATWCKPCVEELPYFEQIGKEYASRKVKIVLVSLDAKKYLESKLKPFLKSKNIQSEVVLLDEPDANLWVEKIAQEWSGAIPASLFVYSPKKEKRFFEKEFTLVDLQNTINSILKPTK